MTGIIDPRHLDEPSAPRRQRTATEIQAEYEAQQRAAAEYDRLFDQGVELIAEKRASISAAMERDRIAAEFELALADGILAIDLAMELTARPRNEKPTRRTYERIMRR